MTSPLDDPRDFGAVDAHERGFRRELIGLLLVLTGAAVLVWVLATADWRLAVGAAAVALITAGFLLGRVPDDEGS